LQNQNPEEHHDIVSPNKHGKKNIGKGAAHTMRGLDRLPFLCEDGVIPERADKLLIADKFTAREKERNEQT
jgi:hypothetical protein